MIYKKFAFTLAEVLITLGIIGVVAALTIPALIANHKKQVVVTRMQKFYSTINQAIKLSEAENGEASNWSGTEHLDSDSLYDFWNNYMLKYFTSKDVIKTSDGILVTLSDGSAFGIYNPQLVLTNGISWMHIVYCVDYKSCKNRLDSNGNKVYNYPFDGKNTFLFKGQDNSILTYYNEATSGNVKTRDLLMNETKDSYGCNQTTKAYCAALIEYDGWKISKDYPIRF